MESARSTHSTLPPRKRERELGKQMIEFRHLRYFTAVAEELNFHRASERVHIDPTPLSRTVRDLEERLGVTLFVRNPRGLALTPAGTCLLEEARKVLLRVNRLQQKVQATDACFRAPLRIGVADGIAQPRLSECLVKWHSVSPQVRLDLVDMRATELAAALKREELDAGFTFGVPEDDALAQEPAWRYSIQAIVPVNHTLSARPMLPIAQLLTFPLVTCTAARHPGLLHQMRSIMLRNTLLPTIASEAHTLAGHVTRVAAGMGVGLIDSGHGETLARSDVVVVPLAEAEHIVTYVVHKHRRSGLPGALQRFIAHAKTFQAAAQA